MAQCSHNENIKSFCRFPRAAPGYGQSELSLLWVIHSKSRFEEVCISVSSLFRKSTNKVNLKLK